VKRYESFNGQCPGSLVVLAILALLVAIAFSFGQFFATQVVEAQGRRQPGKARPKRKTQARTAAVGSRFTHQTHRAPKTKLNCSDCHTIPLREAPDEIAAATKSSIKGFPYHDSCLDCHRETPPKFFKGATPIICTVCHRRSSPRLSARDVSPFPKQSEQAMELEFPGYFPHAQRDHRREKCDTCHLKYDRASVAITIQANGAPYKPAEGTFKTSPSGHATCFKCHWEEHKPRKDECAGCHLLGEDLADEGRNLLTANAREWFKKWPSEWPKRISLKFNHESKSHVAECITCHINITEMNTLDIFKAVVPIPPCAKCHLQPTTPASIGTEMYNEDEDILEGRDNDPGSKEGKNTCTGCHTTPIGSMPPPCSHYLLFDDTYFIFEDYPKSAKQMTERCKK